MRNRLLAQALSISTASVLTLSMAFPLDAFAKQHKPHVKTSHPAPAQDTLLQGHVQSEKQSVLLPADTVVTMRLDTELSARKSQLGQEVHGTVMEPVYLGPYLAVPKNAMLTGQITDINPKLDKLGRNPYLVVLFNQIQEPSDPSVVYPFHAKLIAYKTGLRKHEYVWRLPEKGDRGRAAVKNTVAGAASGFLINPVFGPVIGGGAGLFKSTVVDRFARRGDVRLKQGQVMSIAVDQPVNLPLPGSTPVAVSQFQE